MPGLKGIIFNNTLVIGNLTILSHVSGITFIIVKKWQHYVKKLVITRALKPTENASLKFNDFSTKDFKKFELLCYSLNMSSPKFIVKPNPQCGSKGIRALAWWWSHKASRLSALVKEMPGAACLVPSALQTDGVHHTSHLASYSHIPALGPWGIHVCCL